MKCSSCVSSSRPKSDDEEASPSEAMDRDSEEYRVESPPAIPKRPSTTNITAKVQPMVTIVEVTSDENHSPSPSSSGHHLRPLDIITEETSDVSDTENRPPSPKPDLCFPRPKPRFKKNNIPRKTKLDNNYLQGKQEPTVCVLVDAKIQETSPIDEYRSICTTETVPEEILEVEIIDLGSNSSSLADLTDDGAFDEPACLVSSSNDTHDSDTDAINNNDQQLGSSDAIHDTREQPQSIPQLDNGNDNEPIESAPVLFSPKQQIPEEEEEEEVHDEDVLSEEDNNGYGESDVVVSGNSKTFTQSPLSTNAATQNLNDFVVVDDDDDDGDDDDEHPISERTESDRDDDGRSSLLADVDRASIVTQCDQRNVSEVKGCTDNEENDDDDDVDTSTSSIECCVVTHQSMIGDSGGQSDEMVEQNVEQVVRPMVPIPLPPPPAAETTTTTTAASVSVRSELHSTPPPPPPVTNLGQEVHEGLRYENAQIYSGSDTGQIDPSDADQNSAEAGVDAVENVDESSVLLKILKPSPPPPSSALAEASVENRPTFAGQSCPAVEPNGHSAVGTKIERTVKSEQLSYEIVQDQRVLRKETVFSTSGGGGGVGGGEVILRRSGNNRTDESTAGKEPSPEQKAALVLDLRNELSRIKDAELQEEFRKLELEAARFGEELDKMAVVQPPQTDNLTYYVSKQNDFAVERPTPPRQKPPAMAKSSNDQLYNEWQQRMEEREARRLHKVIKISSSNEYSNGTDSIALPAAPTGTATCSDDPDLGDEFLRKVKERRRKFTIPGGGDSDYDSSAPNSVPGTPVASRKPIPKHIEAEFAEFAEIRKRQQAAGRDEDNHRAPMKTTTTTPTTPPEEPEAKGVESHQLRSRQNINHAENFRRQHQQTPVAEQTPPTSAPSDNGESVKVSALIEVHQQKQRELLRQDSYKAAIRSGPSSVENLGVDSGTEPDAAPVSVSAKCQEFERRLQRSASSDGRKPIKPTTSASTPSVSSSTSFKVSVASNVPPSPPPPATVSVTSASNRIESQQQSFKIAPKFKARATGSGVWSPHNRSTEILTKAELAERSKDSSKSTEPLQPVWTPRSAPPSPVSERREFRPIGFESPTPQRRNLSATPSSRAETPQISAPWTTAPGYDKPVQFTSNPPTTRPEPATFAEPRRHLQNSNSLPTIGSTTTTTTTTRDGGNTPTHSVRFAPEPRQTTDSPTINTLLKSKDGRISQQLVNTYESSNQSNVYQSSASRTTGSTARNQQTYQRSSSGTRLGRGPEISQQPVRVDYYSEPEVDIPVTVRRPAAMAQLSPKKIDGIGPTTREGMPLTLRSEVDENNQAKWYKKMYQTLHKAQNDDDFVTVRYKTRRGNYPYKSAGYQSEPEPNYDSDYTIKYSTLDRRRTPTSLNPNSYSRFNTLQGAAIRSGASQYKNQPGRIENYVPGRSSISEKESKEQLEQQKLSTSKTYTEGNLSRALKDQGYDSDTTLIFRKKEPPSSSALSPIEQKQFYKNMQAGGEIPVQGFRKPAPEKPKDGDTELQVQIQEVIQEALPTLVTNPFLIPPQKITCYPITSITRPLDMFGSFPKEPKSFVPVAPPAPPNRKSSRSNSTLRIMSQIKTKNYDKKTVVEASSCSSSGSRTLRKIDQYRSKSAGPVFATSYVASSIKEEKNLENSTRVAKRYTYRANSSSPVRKSTPSPVAFGRGISKERTFAEEKKRLEEKLPKVCRKDVTVSTSILRNPDLKSPNEVKKALRSSYLPMVIDKPEKLSTTSRALRKISSNFKSASSVYSSKQSLNKASTFSTAPKKEDKALKVTVAISSRGKELLRTSATTAKPQKTKGKSSPTVTIKSNIQKVTKSLGLRSKAPSTQSLARTSSTYSIDSTNSKRKSRATFIPATISSRKSTNPTKTSRKSNIRDPGTLVESYNEHIVQQNDIVRTSSFFQNLFLRNASPTPPMGGSGPDPPQACSVREKARLWNNFSAKSEPLLKQPNYYLTQVKPVSLSKFKTMDSEYGTYHHRTGEVIEQIQRYESLLQLTDEEEEFGYLRGRSSMKIDYSYHERSKSEPPVQTVMAEVVTQDAPRTILGRKSIEYSHATKRSSRSPSCRRIQQFKGEGNVKKIVRARSLSTTDRCVSPSDALVRSRSLNLTSYERHIPICRHRRSDRFQDLNDFYSSLERLGQLEKATSSTDLRPRRRDEDIIDFDLWKKVRNHEKAEREMNQLLHKLKQDQREKDLLFLPHDPDEVRWNSDLDPGLRNKEKSVEDLKGELSKKVLHFEEFTKRELDTRKDHYKPLWRGSSVIDVATQMAEKYSGDVGRKNEFLSLDTEKSYGISTNLLSTLSSDQMKRLKSQLSEIYSNREELTTVTGAEKYVINVPPDRTKSVPSTLKVRSHSVLTKEQVNEAQFKPTLEKESKVAQLQKTFEQKNRQDALCEELKNKIKEKHASHTLPSMKKKERPTILSPKAEYFSLETEYRKFPGGEKSEQIREEIVMRKTKPAVDRERPHSYCETESVSSETSNRTVIYRNTSDDVKTKIKYFEERRKEEVPPVTVYHARESSTDEDDASKMLEERTSQKVSPLPNSQSYTDLKDLFGEKSTASYSYSYQEDKRLPKNFILRSRSSTPEYATCIQTGEVKKIKDKFESLDVNIWKQSVGDTSPRQYQSDSELNRPFGECQKMKGGKKIKVKHHETGDVSRMTHKYEVQSRARSRKRKERANSPIPKNPFRKDDRFMPHINVISKTAALKQEIKSTPQRERSASGYSSGAEVEKIKSKFETAENLSILAHQFPKPTDNARSITAPDQSPPGQKPGRRGNKLRSSSTSPPRHKGKQEGTAFLKQFYDIFADQKFDPSIHRPKYRYVPDRQLDAEYLWKKIQKMTNGSCTKASVTFEEYSSVPPPPPPKGTQLPNSYSPYSKSSNEPESPRRYVESDVNIHYKTPIRYEYKEAIPDDELAYRQAEHMRRVYQEERRRKYMHELEDLQSRRHTDNFAPSQKSPIPLNRYDDFDADLSPKPPNTLPRTIARALYNFQGQTARELSFKKGDIIYLRRQIDKNWYEGEHNAMVGLLPANYIEILPRDGAKPLPKKPQREGKARAKFNFTAQTSVELSLMKGELVTLTRRVDDNWFEGRIGNKKGIFPVSYVEVLTDIGGEESYEIEPIVKPALQTMHSHALTTGYDNSLSNGRISPGIIRETKTVQKTEVLHVDTTNEPISYRALYNYKPQNSDELELLEGDVVYVLEKCDDGWYVGTSARTGCFGTFPGNYVKKL
ncbi:uncharacterized protein LOC131435823 isoform X2 [Malaya genurostris]|uniref:uncharacterized protein LOC131435823 isoform X2 n=1 Tax=Malaya genurostris TaxID=325434 RepID=UPI0026F3B881|nr:uncharacterized protein LOC131435823 isoform X2 [Malaya genurostris]